jgi:hypothetical protein
MPVIFQLDPLEGYGDYSFALKAIANLRVSLADLGYLDPIYLVTTPGGKEQIVKLGGDKEFSVNVITPDEYAVLKQEKGFQLDYYIHGPVPALPAELLPIPAYTPVLLTPEYSYDRGFDQLARVFVNPVRQKLDVVKSGLAADEGGIFSTPELVRLRKDGVSRDKYWNELREGLRTSLLAGKTPAEYQNTTELYFQYGHDMDRDYGNSCEHYLQIHQEMTKGSPKNQELICIGPNAGAKKSALNKVLPTLIENGFNKISFIDKEGTEIVLHDDHADNPKTYRLRHSTYLEHREMIALFALSGNFVGVTGDQSFGEALSAGKIPVYERRMHKVRLGDNFLALVDKLTEDSRLVNVIDRLLYKQKAVDGNSVSLQNLMNDPQVKKSWAHFCDQVSNMDLTQSLIKTIKPIIEKVVAIKKLDAQIEAALKAEDFTQIKELIAVAHESIYDSKEQLMVRYLVEDLAPRLPERLRYVPDIKDMHKAAAQGNMNLVRYFLEVCQLPLTSQTLDYAAAPRFMDSSSKKELLCYLLNYSITQGDLASLRYLVEEQLIQLNIQTLAKKTLTDLSAAHPDLLRFLLTQAVDKKDWALVNLITDSIKDRRNEEGYHAVITDDFLNKVVKAEEWDLALNLMEICNVKPNQETVLQAESLGNKELVEYLVVTYQLEAPSQLASGMKPSSSGPLG